MANERHDIHFVWHAAFLREQRGKWYGRLRTTPLEERRDTEKQSFESGRAARKMVRAFTHGTEKQSFESGRAARKMVRTFTRGTEKQSFESGRAVIPGEKIEMRRKAQMRGSYEFTEQFYKSN